MRFIVDGAAATAAAWILSACWITTVVPPPAPHHLTFVTTTTMQPQTTHNNALLLSQGVSQWIASSASATTPAQQVQEPSDDDVQLLRQAFSEFYSNTNRNLEKSEQLLSKVIQIWNEKKQPADEVAGLYRVRGDCYMAMADAKRAYADYDQAVQLLQKPNVLNDADPAELPASLLGRARSIKASLMNTPADSGSSSSSITQKQIQQAARDLEQVLKLSSREEWDDEQDLLEDGATRNPYAAWEWGSMLRKTNDNDAWNRASQAHLLAANAFQEIGDQARAAISYTDAGIDLAGAAAKASASGSNSDHTIIFQQATTTLQQAIKKTIGVQSKDVNLLNRVIAKEGEGRMALAALLWSNGAETRAEAESVLGETCIRLDQLVAQKMEKNNNMMKKSISNSATTTTLPPPPSLRFSIDDDGPNMDVSCFRFKNPVFLNQLGWPEELQQKVIQLETLR